MIRRLSFYLAMAILTGCATSHPPVEPLSPTTDKYGCEVPIQVVALNRQGLDFETISLKEFAIGKVNYQSNPDLKLLLEKEARSSIVAEYLLCNAIGRRDIDPHNPKQIQYLRNFFHFIQSGPSSSQIADYPRQHPFPDAIPPKNSLKLEQTEKDPVHISMDCHYGFLPTSMPSGGRLYVMAISAIPKEIGGGGLWEFFSKGGEMKWPEMAGGQAMAGYSCQVINHSNVPIFNISMSFDFVFREAVHDGHTLKSGKITLARDYSISMTRIDGSNGVFVFHVINESAQFVQVTLPKSVQFEMPGGKHSEITHLIQPPLIMNFVPMKTS